LPSDSRTYVTDDKFIYRVGGLSFINVDGEEDAIFNSTDHFARYDVEADTWTELAPLPAPRSSLDAAVVGRMFLRLLPVGEDRLIALGGTDGMSGRIAIVETLKVDPSASVGEKIVS